ncbi:hypothetical protein TI05_14030 [Achromatium sp. WMS3]|nr:hypothetical protein TI05_14030 [Achromatium sp. WMS3]
MKENDQIRRYYDKLAPKYDVERFANSYGQYLHKQEQLIMQDWLFGKNPDTCLDMGCGTGRFLKYAKHGIDISEPMLLQAQFKFPEHDLQVSSITNTLYMDNTFDAVFSLHVFFHLEHHVIKQAIKEAYRILKPGGLLIFDFPSQTRRQLVKYQKDDWHGNTVLNVDTVREYSNSMFTLKKFQGVMMFPIHRIPDGLRDYMRTLDALLCRSPLKFLASYNLVCLQRNA